MINYSCKSDHMHILLSTEKAQQKKQKEQEKERRRKREKMRLTEV